MKNILAIGSYDKKGKFNSQNWNAFTSWIRKYCDKVEVYSDITKKDMEAIFGERNIISEYIFQDTSNYHSYELLCDDKVMDTLIQWNYNINGCNLSHLFFYMQEVECAYMEINDFYNFVVFNTQNQKLEELIHTLESVEENRKICSRYQWDIEDMAEDTWKALGT